MRDDSGMSTKIYKKVGRRYVEVGSFDNESLHYPHGAHLVWSRPGGTLTMYQIEPADAALLAASARMKEAMLDAMRAADRWEPDGPMTKRKHRAWLAYKAIAGEESALRLAGPSMSDVVEAGIKVLREGVKND